MAWVLLVVAGLLEVAWALLLPATRGFTRLVPTAGFAVLLATSMTLLSVAARTLPIGTAYAVWVGIGATGTAVLGMVVYDEPATAARLLFLTLLVVSVIGLKLTH